MSSRRPRPAKHANFCGAPKTDRRSARKSVQSFADIVRVYREFFRKGLADENTFLKKLDFDAALKTSALCELEDGKRMAHQYRLKARVLRAAHAKLRKASLQSCSSFDELFRTVEEAIGELAGIGPLTVYDISFRLGVYLDLHPEKIYLHAGTRQGARVLGLGAGADSIDVKDVPVALRRLTAAEIEDCLCIFKDELQQIVASE
jgi:hypothetical protein